MEEQSYLVHYGVLGMKWGVRKARKNMKRVSNHATAAVYAHTHGYTKEANRQMRFVKKYNKKASRKIKKLYKRYGDELYSEIEKLPISERVAFESVIMSKYNKKK